VTPDESDNTATRLRWSLVALAVLGVAVSGYLTLVHFSGAPLVCAGEGGCSQVQSSRFAVVAGVPVALLGLLFYGSLVALGGWQALRTQPKAALISLALFGVALSGTLYSGYLTYLEVAVIGAICLWCVASALLATSITGLAAWDLAR